jgi:flagellar hook assembly protein FlgD
VAVRPTENKFSLQQNYPNPFTNKTTIDFNIAQPTHVSLSIYNLSGQKVKTLVDADYMPGAYHLQWHGRTEAGQTVPDGIYLYQLQTENGMLAKKMILKK